MTFRAILVSLALAAVALAPAASSSGLLPSVCPLVPLACAPNPDVPVIGDVTVGSGRVATYSEDAYVMTGTATVENGGTLRFDGAAVTFTDASGGIAVRPGGRLEIVDGAEFAAARPGTRDAPSDFVITLDPGAVFVLRDAVLTGLAGVFVATNLSTLESSVVSEAPLGFSFDGATATLDDVDFYNVRRAVTVDGGDVTLSFVDVNAAQEGLTAQAATLTVADSSFAQNDFGLILRATSGSFTQTSFSDKSLPDTRGAQVCDGSTASFPGASFTDWGSAIVYDSTSSVDATGAYFGANGANLVALEC